MQNDRDDKYEGSGDSEYHFSGDDSQYEVDPEAAEQPASLEEAAHGGGIVEVVTRKKRMIISLVVFIAMIGLVYKMVSSPGSSTDIIPQQAPVVANQGAQQAAPDSVAKQQMPAAPITDTAPQASQVAMGQSSPSLPQQAMQPQPTQQQPMQQQASTSSSAEMMQSPQQPPQFQGGANMPQQVNQPPAQAVPDVMSAVQPPARQPMVPQTLPNMTFATSPAGTSGSQAVDADAAALAAENAKLYSELQAEYAKRLGEYQEQNKGLQAQVQTLNARVATMESEMTKLVETLTQTAGLAPSGSAPAAAPEQAAPPPRVPYNVQAIIPGRAWLRSNNGDTLTVAEGDEIKGVGRVSKIDPYDGVVEINVHGKTVSLSYGNGS